MITSSQAASSAAMTTDNPSIAELTEADLSTLWRAADLRRRFDAGIFPITIGQRSHFQKLVRRGLLVFDAWGRDIDGEVERDVEIYKLTAAGEACIAEDEAARAENAAMQDFASVDTHGGGR